MSAPPRGWRVGDGATMHKTKQPKLQARLQRRNNIDVEQRIQGAVFRMTDDGDGDGDEGIRNSKGRGDGWKGEMR